MVEMAVRQDNGVQMAALYRLVPAVLRLFLFAALEQAAIDKDAGTTRVITWYAEPVTSPVAP